MPSSHTVGNNIETDSKPVDLSKGFSRAYLLCLLSIALLTLLGQFLMAGMAAEEQSDAQVLSAVDHQRRLCEDIGSRAAAIQASSSIAEKFKSLARLSSDVREWKASLAAMANENNERGLPSSDYKTVRDLCSQLRPEYLAISEGANGLLIHFRSPEQVSANVQRILSHEATVLEGLDGVVNHYRVESEKRLDRLRTTDLLVGVLILIVLCTEFAFVFRPKMKALQDTSRRLGELNYNLSFKNAALEAQGLQLEAQQVKVMAQQSELERTNDQLLQQQAELQSLNSNLDETHGLYAEAARRMEELFHGVPVACFTFDKAGNIEDWNKACEQLHGIRSYEAQGQSVSELLKDAMHADELGDIVRIPFTGKTVEGMVWQKKYDDGKFRWIMSSAFPILNQNKDVVAAVCSNVDITDRTLYAAQLEESMVQLNEYSLELEMQRAELEDANAKLEALATTDGLTGLRNHRSFQERLEQDSIKADEKGTPLSLILLDVDNFKKFNDTYGHPEGDKVLKGVAAVLLGYATEPYTAARYGGEEFVVALPGLGPDEAEALAEGMRAKIQAAAPTGVEVTASFGVATWAVGMRSRTELIAQADKALYQSKALGRNRVTHARTMWLDELEDAA